jgi:hypothetical protein
MRATKFSKQNQRCPWASIRTTHQTQDRAVHTTACQVPSNSLTNLVKMKFNLSHFFGGNKAVSVVQPSQSSSHVQLQQFIKWTRIEMRALLLQTPRRSP